VNPHRTDCSAKGLLTLEAHARLHPSCPSPVAMTPLLHRPQAQGPLQLRHKLHASAPVESLRKIRYETTLQALLFALFAPFAVKYLPSFPLGSLPVAMTPPLHRPRAQVPLQLRSNPQERSATKAPTLKSQSNHARSSSDSTGSSGKGDKTATGLSRLQIVIGSPVFRTCRKYLLR
jgi:hypothetical protein